MKHQTKYRRLMAVKVSEDYEVANNEELDKLLARDGIETTGFYADNHGRAEFYSDDITIYGKSYKSSHEALYSEDMFDIGGEEIKGLFCPDCHAQAFKTDYKQVAVCGDYPGWYFFYRRIDQDVKSKTKIVVNSKGELVESEGTDKNEAAF